MVLQRRREESAMRLSVVHKLLLLVYSLILIFFSSVATTLFTSSPSTTVPNHHRDGIDNFQPLKQKAKELVASMGPTPTSLCTATEKLFPPGTLEPQIALARQYHLQGGNLKALQLMLDEWINPTYKRYAIRFNPAPKNDEILGDQKEAANDLLKNNWDIVGYLKMLWSANAAQERGGYYDEMPGIFRPKDKIYENRYIDVVEPWSYDRWNVSMGPVGPDCNHLVKLGEPGYIDFKYFCGFIDDDDPSNKTYFSKSHDEECHVFSIGSNDQWTFERTLVKVAPHCVTHTFDCTLKKGRPKHKPRNGPHKFYNYCIGNFNGRQGDKRYRRYNNMVGELAQMTSPPKLLKMDVEGFEYDVFSDMVKTPDLLPEQIIVELHWTSKMTDNPWTLRTRQTGELALLFSMLFSAGYLPVFKSYNHYCVPCLEVLLVRVLC